MTKGKQWLLRLVLLSASASVAVLIGEATVRLLGLGYGNSPLVGHPVWHHWHESDYDWLCWDPHDQYGGFRNRFNSVGMATGSELPANDEPAYLFLGDSFTEALQVREEDRFVSQIEREAGIRCLNFGCSSHSPVLSRLVLERHIDRLSVKGIFLQIYANDIDGDSAFRSEGVHENGRIIAVPGNKTSLAVRVGRRSHLARLLRKVWLSVKFKREIRQQTEGQWAGDAWSPLFNKPIEESFPSEKLHAISSSLLELRDICAEKSIEFAVFVVPDRGAMKEEKRDFLHEFVGALCGEHEIEFVELVGAFKTRDVSTLYFPSDIHWTEKGHEAVADVLATRIRRASLQHSTAQNLDLFSASQH